MCIRDRGGAEYDGRGDRGDAEEKGDEELEAAPYRALCAACSVDGDEDADEAAAAGMEPAEYIAQKLTDGSLGFACEDPDATQNYPRLLANWRTNLLGSSAKGAEFFMKHMLGCENDVNATELTEGKRPTDIRWRDDTPCLLYTSPSPRDKRQSRMPSSA